MSPGPGRGLSVCSQCGARTSGNYCNTCGAPLHPESETLTTEVRSRITDPLLGALAFIKGVWLVVCAPRRFFDSCFNRSEPLAGLPFPLAWLWRRIEAGPQKVVTPFQCLLAGLALAAIVSGVATGVKYRVGLGEYAGRGIPAVEQATGKAIARIDLEHLTGVGAIDGPIHQIVDLLYYGFFAGVVSAFLVGTGIRSNQLLQYYAYGKGAALALFSAASIAGAGFLLAVSGLSLERAAALDDLAEALGDGTSLYFLFVLPVAIFPKILPVSKRRMRYAAAGGAFAWIFLNFVVRQALLWRYGLLISFM